MMTRHPVRLEQLPPDLREAAQTDERGRVDHPSEELRAEVFRRFTSALEPLRLTGKLGGIEFELLLNLVFAPSLAYLELGQRSAGPQAPRRVSPSELARRGEPRRDALVPRAARAHVPRDCSLQTALDPPTVSVLTSDTGTSLPRPQCGDLVQAHAQRRRAVRLPLLRGRAPRVGAAAARARRARRGRLRDVQERRALADAGPPGCSASRWRRPSRRRRRTRRCSRSYCRPEKRRRWKIRGSPSPSAAFTTRPMKMVRCRPRRFARGRTERGERRLEERRACRPEPARHARELVVGLGRERAEEPHVLGAVADDVDREGAGGEHPRARVGRGRGRRASAAARG